MANLAEQFDSAFFDRTAAELLTIPFCPWEPNPGPQTAFLLDMGREALYGGSAGSSKSVGLLMAASQFLTVPGYSALLLRKTFADLNRPGALMDLAAKWWQGQSGVKFDPQNHTYIFNCPGGGTSKIEFGGLDNIHARLKYQGGAWMAVMYDELTQFRESDYTYLFSRLRRVAEPPLSNVPIRMRSACLDEGDVLTENGWKPIQEIAIGESVWSMDIQDGYLELKPVVDTYRSHHVEPLVRIRKKNLYMSMTQDHRVVYKKFGTSVFEIKPFDEHTQSCIEIARAGEGLDAKGMLVDPLGWGVDAYLAFLGLFVAEGCTVVPRNGNYKVLITQCQKEKQPAVHEVLSRLPYRYCLSRNGDFQITNKALWEHLRPLGKAHDKHIPRSVMNQLDAPQLRLLLKWLIFGDGHITPFGGLSYVTVSRQLADDVCEIGVKLGYKIMQTRTVLDNPNHRDRYTIYLTMGKSVTSKVETSKRQNDVAIEAFNGEVYCIKVADNSNFVVRQRGTVWISGNTNPGGPGHDWVRKRFIVPWETWQKGGPRPSRNFHPARLKDNPKLDKDDYIASLMELDPVTRAQLLRGDWEIRPDGRMFKRDWFLSCKRSEIPGNCHWTRFWDMASTDPQPGLDPDYTVGVLMGRAPDGRHYIADIRRWRVGAGENDLRLRATALHDTNRVAQVMEQEPGASGKIAIHHYRVGAFAGCSFRGVPASGKSRGRVTTIAVGRHTTMAKILAASPLASAAEAGQVYLVEEDDDAISWDRDGFLEEMEIFPDGEHDDQSDAAAGALNVLSRMPVWALQMSESNEELTKENEWRPEAFEYRTKSGDEFMGQVVVDKNASMEEVRVRTADAFRV